MEQLTREERIARIRKMREERRQAFLEKRWKVPSFLEKFNLQKKEEEKKEEVKEEPVVEEAPKKKRGRKKKAEKALDE